MSEIQIPIVNKSGLTWELHFFDVVDSTNQVAMSMAQEERSEGHVIFADHQNSGRGRLDRQWIDSPGTSVLMSILLRPKFPKEFLYLITSALSLATLQILNEKFTLSCQLKWPNDLMVSDRKIAGILAEANFGVEGDPVVVVGMGLNCKQSGQELEDLGRPACSIFSETGVALDLDARMDLAAAIAARFASLYLDLEDPSGRISLSSLYRQQCSTIGKLVQVEMADETLIGVASDISVEGNLLVETDSCMRAVPAGDVIHVNKAG